MVHWQDEEVRQLLTIRAQAGISRQIVGTARDSVVYDQITKVLCERGIIRTKVQVNTKLKALKKQYQTLVERNNSRRSGGSDHESWCYLSLCEPIWGPRVPVALQLLCGQEMASSSSRRSPPEQASSSSPRSSSTPEPPSSDSDEKPPVTAAASVKDSGCSTGEIILLFISYYFRLFI